jgi:hypothetical protein
LIVQKRKIQKQMQEFTPTNNQNNFTNNPQSQFGNIPNNGINQGYPIQPYTVQQTVNQFPNPNYNQPIQQQAAASNVKVSKALPPKKSIFSVHNVLISLLLLYAIFSFAWIAILYAGVDGNRICLEDNFVCNFTVPYTKQAVIAVNSNIETKNELVKQKNAKNYIRDIWQNQTILNDNLIKRQQVVEKSIQAFQNYIQNYIKFTGDKPEFQKGFTKVDLENKKTEVEDQLTNLKILQDNNYQNKTLNQQQISKLYQDLGERQEDAFIDNRATEDR